MAEIRIQKAIASTGYLSRRKAEEAILEGRVQVNGAVIRELGAKLDPARDELRVDGKALGLAAPRTVVLLNKPRKVVTTKSDPQGRPTVMEYFPPELQAIKPVGRLDFDTEGMLILTDDGDLANLLAHPRYGVRKVYQALVQGLPADRALKRLASGVELEDGPGSFESVRVTGRERLDAWLEIEVSEGRNRFVRRMCEAVDHPVLRLKRIGIGGLGLEGLPPGKYRVLDDSDLRRLGVPDVAARKRDEPFR